MSMFRRIDSLLDGKTSDQLASDVAARERERAEQDQLRKGQPPAPSGAGGPPREQDAKDGRPASGDRTPTTRSPRPAG